MYAPSYPPGPSPAVEWVRVGEPEVQRQRGKWVVRQSGYDPSTGRRRVKQLGTFATKGAAVARQKVLAEGRAGSAGETLREFLEQVWLLSKDGRVEVGTPTGTSGPSAATSSPCSAPCGLRADSGPRGCRTPLRASEQPRRT